MTPATSQVQPSEMDNAGGPYLQQPGYGKTRHIPDRPPASPRKNPLTSQPPQMETNLPKIHYNQNPKNVVKLVEETLNTKSFDIK